MPNQRVLQDTRYTATIEFTKVETYKPGDRNGRTMEDQPSSKVPTSSRVTVRSGTLPDLQRKVAAHVALLDEQDLTGESME